MEDSKKSRNWIKGYFFVGLFYGIIFGVLIGACFAKGYYISCIIMTFILHISYNKIEEYEYKK